MCCSGYRPMGWREQRSRLLPPGRRRHRVSAGDPAVSVGAGAGSADEAAFHRFRPASWVCIQLLATLSDQRPSRAAAARTSPSLPRTSRRQTTRARCVGAAACPPPGCRAGRSTRAPCLPAPAPLLDCDSTLEPAMWRQRYRDAATSRQGPGPLHAPPNPHAPPPAPQPQPAPAGRPLSLRCACGQPEHQVRQGHCGADRQDPGVRLV